MRTTSNCDARANELRTQIDGMRAQQTATASMGSPALSQALATTIADKEAELADRTGPRGGTAAPTTMDDLQRRLLRMERDRESTLGVEALSNGANRKKHREYEEWAEAQQRMIDNIQDILAAPPIGTAQSIIEKLRVVRTLAETGKERAELQRDRVWVADRATQRYGSTAKGWEVADVLEHLKGLDVEADNRPLAKRYQAALREYELVYRQGGRGKSTGGFGEEGFGGGRSFGGGGGGGRGRTPRGQGRGQGPCFRCGGAHNKSACPKTFPNGAGGAGGTGGGGNSGGGGGAKKRKTT